LSSGTTRVWLGEDMNLIVQLVCSPWFWVSVFLSISGGIVVAWGLAVEKQAEKLMPPDNFKPDVFYDIVKVIKKKEERGWKILMTGIVMEVVAALLVSIISGLEVAGLNQKAEDATVHERQLEAQIFDTSNIVAQANTRAVVADANAAQANERAAKFDADRALVEREAEQIRSTNFILQAQILELEARTEPRSISPEQTTNLIERLKNCPKGKVFVKRVLKFDTAQVRHHYGRLLILLFLFWHVFSFCPTIMRGFKPIICQH
jgi:hypothetical protein